MGNKDKEKNKDQGNSNLGTMEGVESAATKDARDACQAARDLSQEREARDAALTRQVAEAVARGMAKAHMHYQALLNERSTAAMQPALR